MKEKAKNFLFDNDLYVADCNKITRLHKILQIANFIVAIIKVLAVLIMSVENEEMIMFVPIAVLVAGISLFLNKLALNVAFGWLYDVRVMRMNLLQPSKKTLKRNYFINLFAVDRNICEC